MTVRRDIAWLALAGAVWLLAGGAEIWGAEVDQVDKEQVKITTDVRDTVDTPVVSPDDTIDDRDGRILSSDQVEELVDPSPQVPSDFRPPRPEYRKIPPELAAKLREFNVLREKFLKEQEGLIRKYKGATEKDRDLIRQRLQLRREEWLERSRSMKEDSRERLRDLIRELPKHREALEAARDAARDAVREEVNDVKRRGVDD